MPIRFAAYLLIVASLAALAMLASCTSRSREPTSKASPTEPLAAPQPQATTVPPAVAPDMPRFSALGWKTDFSQHNVPYSEILSGGVPRDGIPPIYKPQFGTVSQADSWLTDKEPVAALEIGSERRAYPLRILIWHEIVNDTISGIPVAITYCPLCNTAVAFDRRVEGKVLTFGVSGLLRHSDLVMWDHETESLWQQATGEGIVGHYTGKLLELLPASIISWRDFKAAYPRGKVLSQETGYRRSYGSNPYSGYDSSRRPFLFSGKLDPRLPALERVVGLGRGETAIAYPFSALARVGVVNDKVGEQRIVVFYQSGTVSALDDSQIAESRDVGAAAVFSPQVEGKELHFEIRDGLITDRQTGSQWNLAGRATRGPLAGKKLQPVVHGSHFWFAWAAFEPQTRVFSP